MAETIVKLVLQKVTDSLEKEAFHLWGVEKKVEEVRRELDWIRVFLKDADMKQIQDEMQKQWVREVREVAYWIEDIIDTFLCAIPPKMQGKRAAVKRTIAKTKKLLVIHKLGDEMNQILARLQDITDKKVRYGINSLGEGSGQGKRLPVRPPVLPDIEETNIIGFDADREKIVKQLLDDSSPKRSVVSIVGQGGLGKTTLAKKVYNSSEIQRAFDTRIWVAVSQEFELIDVLRKILKNLGKEEVGKNKYGKDEEYFLYELYQSLREKKYLLTIDDIWKTDFWMAIEKALPNDKNGSRILMTTRFFRVAKEADPTHEPYKLNFLTKESSLELFLNKAILNQEISNKCPNDLLNLAEQFVAKCGRLPLAIVVLGGLLANKQPTYTAWNKVMQTMNWHVDEQKVCMEIVGTSYENLPLALKSCFMYFAAFPEVHVIGVKSLLQMWIAEGFIPQEENRTLEDTAQSFLEDLVQRSMVQVSARSLLDDSIEYCRIHDLLRDVAIQKAKEDNFLTVCLNRDGEQSCSRTCRVAVHNYCNCDELMIHTSRNLRTLLCFNSRMPNCARHMLLKVLSDMRDISANRSDQIKMKMLEGLSQLRYLYLSKTVIWNKRCFKKLVSGMRFLQTLDLRDLYESHFEMPDCVWHIKSLRHVILSWQNFTLGPPSTTDLRNLQTLRGVKSRKSWKTTLPKLPNLRLLAIEVIEGFPWEQVVVFLHTMRKLDRLTIKGRDIPIEVVDMRSFPFYHQLMMLRYWGNFSCHGRKMDFNIAMFPTHLTSLIFQSCKLQQDDLAVMERLHGLKILKLLEAYPNQTMRCSAGGFPRLCELYVVDLKELENWTIEEGAMPMLQELAIMWCPMLQVPPGMRHLLTLHKLSWYDWSCQDDSSVSKAEDIRNMCKHVANITIDI